MAEKKKIGAGLVLSVITALATARQATIVLSVPVVLTK